MRRKTEQLVILSQFQLEKNQARIQINWLDKLEFKESSTFWPKYYNWTARYFFRHA